MIEPAPETREALAAALARAAEVTPTDELAWRELLEQLMLAASPVDASFLGQLLRESRAAWLLLLPRPQVPEGAHPTALVVGRALAGTGAGLARLGWRVTLLDPAFEDAPLATFRGACTGAPITLERQLAEGARFDLVLVEEGLAEDDPLRDEALTRSTDLVAMTADNLLAYKGSSGHRADFRLTRPLTLLKRLLGLDDERRSTLSGHRRALAERIDRQAIDVRATALYPDRRDYSHAIDLDEAGPDLTLGPKERANRVKLAGYRAGLFATFAPSYGLWTTRDGSHALGTRPRQLDVLLGQVAERLGYEGPVPLAEHVVATRGNSALVHTSGPSRFVPPDALDAAGPDRAQLAASLGSWIVRVPLGHRPEAAARQNFDGLTWMRARFADFPMPEPLLDGLRRPGESDQGEAAAEFAGITAGITVESRLAGLGAGQLSGDAEAMGRLTAECGELLAGLVVEPAAAVTEHDFDELFGARFQTVRSRAAVPSTITALDRMQDELRELAVGLVVPRVACHNDLRPKHVVARVTGGAAQRGQVIGLVDWSCLDRRGLPLYDLVHLIASERTQLPGSSSRLAWDELQDASKLARHERDALEAYERALDLPPEWRTVIARAYPVLFGAMAEAHWDYSRPRWLRRLFGIGAE